MSVQDDPRPTLPKPLLSAALIEKAVSAAKNFAAARGATISVAVVDNSGRLAYFARGEDCSYISFETARGKAVLASGFRMPSAEATAASAGRAAFWATVSEKLDVVIAPGGYPLVLDGELIGGIGCGGGHGDLDELCALEAIRVVNDF